MDTKKLELLFSYLFMKYENIHLINLFEDEQDEKSIYIDLKENENKVDAEIFACMLGFLRRYDDSYIKYAYKFNGIEYGFAWETYYDETHRMYVQNAEETWYDSIEQADMFTVKVNSSEPKRHFITDKKYSQMNGKVVFLGSRKFKK